MARQPAVLAALCLTAALMACSGDDDGGTETADRAEAGGDQDALRRELLAATGRDTRVRYARRERRETVS